MTQYSAINGTYEDNSAPHLQGERMWRDCSNESVNSILCSLPEVGQYEGWNFIFFSVVNEISSIKFLLKFSL